MIWPVVWVVKGFSRSVCGGASETALERGDASAEAISDGVFVQW